MQPVVAVDVGVRVRVDERRDPHDPQDDGRQGERSRTAGARALRRRRRRALVHSVASTTPVPTAIGTVVGSSYRGPYPRSKPRPNSSSE